MTAVVLLLVMLAVFVGVVAVIRWIAGITELCEHCGDVFRHEAAWRYTAYHDGMQFPVTRTFCSEACLDAWGEQVDRRWRDRG